jgi:hypothetical protein
LNEWFSEVGFDGWFDLKLNKLDSESVVANDGRLVITNSSNEK